MLANGRGGWVQTANFVLTGLMVVAAAAGFGSVYTETFEEQTIGTGSQGASFGVNGATVSDVCRAAAEPPPERYNPIFCPPSPLW